MIWFSSDQHFGHEPIIEFCERPFASLPEMDGEMIRKWNACVRPDDTIYIVGDFSFYNPKDTAVLVAKLNGRKILIKGNHDKHSRKQYEDWGFLILEECVIEYFGKRIRLSHYPYWPDADTLPNVQKKELRFKHLRPTERSDEFLICGHVHRWWKTQGRMINVGVDVWGFKPVGLWQIEREIAAIERAELERDRDICETVLIDDLMRGDVPRGTPAWMEPKDDVKS